VKFKPSYKTAQLNLDGYKKLLDGQMREALAVGLAAWLDATATEVPVWSGASRATFLKVASQIGYPVPIDGISVADRTAIGQAASKGELVADIESGLYTFTYATNLPWLIWNEYHDATVEPDPLKGCTLPLRKPGPYQFQVKGTAAFLHNTGDTALPAVAPHIVAKLLR
jgi:hypothetical protein